MARGRQSNARNRPAQAPPPPAHLSEKEATEWQAVCSTQNAEWLETGPGPMLEDYCAGVVRLRKVRELVRLAEANPDNKGLAEPYLYDLADKTSQAVQRLARALRLTPQSRVRADKAGNKPGQPWTPDGGDDGDADDDEGTA